MQSAVLASVSIDINISQTTTGIWNDVLIALEQGFETDDILEYLFLTLSFTPKRIQSLLLYGKQEYRIKNLAKRNFPPNSPERLLQRMNEHKNLYYRQLSAKGEGLRELYDGHKVKVAWHILTHLPPAEWDEYFN
jgi:hypothetical protein